MDLATLSSAYGAFYAPAFRLSVAGKDLLHTRQVAVTQVEVGLAVGKAGHFSFTVVDAFDEAAGEFRTSQQKPLFDLFAFGTVVRIQMGYASNTNLASMILGVVTNVSTSFAEGGAPELVVSGQDHLFHMMSDRNSRSWQDKSDSDVVAELAVGYGLGIDAEPTEKHPQIEQNQESDHDFIKKLAKRNNFEFYVDASALDRSPTAALRFGPRRYEQDEQITLEWGKGLLKFAPEVNLAKQVTAVEVYGWDPQGKKAIVGRARAGDESGRKPGAQSGGDSLKAALGREPVLQVRMPVFTEAEAKRHALSILHERAREFVTGDAECVGLPDLRPDRRVEIKRVGQPFSTHYYVDEATHKIDGGGYRTRFKVKETTLPHVRR